MRFPLYIVFALSLLLELSCRKDSDTKRTDNKPHSEALSCFDQDHTSNFVHIPNPRIGVVITAFNRPEYLRPMLESLKASEMDESVSVVIVDDASEHPAVIQMINAFHIPSINKDVKKIRFTENRGLVAALLAGMEYLKDSTDYITNLDPDVYVKKRWIPTMLKTFEAIQDPKAILSGFNTTSHKTIGTCSIFDRDLSFCEKQDLGGINFFFTSEFYRQNFAPWLEDIEKKSHWKEWDWDVMKCMQRNKLKLYSSSPSVIQHLGAGGTNTSYASTFDFADDF